MKKQNTHRKPPKLPEFLLRALFPDNGSYSTIGDLEEVYNIIVVESGIVYAWFWYWAQMLKSLPACLKNSIYWSLIMFKNYIKIAARHLIRYKGYSFLNILGLSAGIAGCLLIALYVNFELSYDKYHKDYDRIYRIALDQTTSNGSRYYAAAHFQMGPAVIEKFSQTESAVRITEPEYRFVRYLDKLNEEDGLYYADPGIFSMLSIDFIRGNPETAIIRPQTAVLSENIAEKYFGTDDPIGKTIAIDTLDYEITGIIKDSRRNTHLKYRIIMSIETVKDDMHYRNWSSGAHSTYTYVKLAHGTDIKDYERQITQMENDLIKEELEKVGYKHNYFLQPMADIHLHSDLRGELEPPGNRLYIYIFSVAGLLILVIACMNFINLSTARSANRACEVGLRKVVGAKRGQLIQQFLGESILVTSFSLILAIVLVGLFLPVFNNISGSYFSFSDIFQPGFFLGFCLITLLIGALSGCYPAIFLSSFLPVLVLKGAFSRGTRGGFMRKALVVSQFSITVFLIISTFIVYGQLDYMKNRHLGFDKEQKLVISLPRLSMLRDNYQTVKSELLRNASVINASASSTIPGRRTFFWRMWPSGERDTKAQGMNFINIDEDFLSVFDIRMAVGTPLSADLNPEILRRSYVLNEAAVEAFGWSGSEEALGKELLDRNNREIIGVVKDFHIEGLQNQIEPLIMSIWSDHFRYITLTVNTDDLDKTISFVQNKIHKFFPDVLFNYFFLDTDFNSHYRFEEKIGRIFGLFTILGLFIACLGLFGLASFIAEQRTKEIGIRKVLGANVSSIVAMLTREFVKWVFVGNLIAWPFAFFAAEKWLSNFAFRTDIHLWVFFVSGFLSLLISFSSVSFQALKASLANPVKALKYE